MDSLSHLNRISIIQLRPIVERAILLILLLSLRACTGEHRPSWLITALQQVLEIFQRFHSILKTHHQSTIFYCLFLASIGLSIITIAQSTFIARRPN